MTKTNFRATTMGMAFFNATLKCSADSPLVKTCCRVLAKPGAGLTRERVWNASLSYGTAQALKKQGVLVG